MTPGFWISSITVAGHPTRRDSSVGFESGLNVIYGPSNSGKSWVLQCIDYVFGLKADEFVLDENSGYTEVRMGVRTAQGSLTLSRSIGEGANNIEVSSTDPRIESGVYKRQSSGRSPLLSSVWLKLIGYDAPENLKIIKNQNLETQALTWRTFWHALYADEDRISTKKQILLPLQATAQPAFKCALASLITGKDYAAYARDEPVETRKLRNNAIIDYLEPLPKQLEERIELIDKALGSSDPAEIQQRIDELTAELERVQQRITHATVQGQDVVARLQQVRDSLAESRSLRNRYEELAASYRARIERFDFVEEGHALTAHREPATTCPVCTQALPPEARSAVPEPDLRERHDLAARLNDLRQTIHQMDVEQAPLQEQEQDFAAEAEHIARRISGELEPQLQALSTSLASHNAIIAMQAEREQHLERKQAIENELEERKNRTFPKGNFNPLDEYPKTFWSQMGTNLLDVLGACVFPRLKDARFSHELFDAVINGKTKAKEGQGYRSFVNTAVMLALREYLASEDATHNPGLLIIDTPLLGLDDPQLDPELQEARETIPAALYDYLALEQDGGQMIIADNTKFMPDIEPLKDRCNLIVFTKREGEARYGFLLDAQDEDLIDLEGTDDN